MQTWPIYALYGISCVLFIPCFVLGRMANLHNPAAGVNETLANWSVFFGLVAGVTGMVALVWMYMNAMSFRG